MSIPKTEEDPVKYIVDPHALCSACLKSWPSRSQFNAAQTYDKDKLCENCGRPFYLDTALNPRACKWQLKQEEPQPEPDYEFYGEPAEPSESEPNEV